MTRSRSRNIFEGSEPEPPKIGRLRNSARFTTKYWQHSWPDKNKAINLLQHDYLFRLLGDVTHDYVPELHLNRLFRKSCFFFLFIYSFFSWITTMFEKLWIKVIRNNLDRVGEKRIFPNGQGQLGGPHTRLYFQLKKNFKKIVTCKILNAQLSEHKRIGKR